MRKCPQCQTEMVEDLRIRNTGDACGLVVTHPGLFGKLVGKVKAAVCPSCGEVSLYIEDPSKLNS